MSIIKVNTNAAGAEEKLRAMLRAADNMQPLFQVVGNTLLNRIRLCFKMGIDPWRRPWEKIKWRAPRVRQRAIKNAEGEVTGYKRLRDKEGRLRYTKAGAAQIKANATGNAGQPLRDTGRLRNSITSKATRDSVTVGTNVIYAAVHQFGKTITPKRAKRLVFPGPNGELIFAKRVTIPARPYMPLRRNSSVVALPPEWSVDVVRAMRTYFRKAAEGKN